MKFYIVMIVSCIAFIGCAKQNLSNQNTENTSKDNSSQQITETLYNDDGSCDMVSIQTLNTVDSNFEASFETLQGKWECEGDIISFYTEDNYYMYDDGVYNCNVVITELSIDDSNKVMIVVGGGSEQCSIKGEILDENRTLCIGGKEYKKNE